MFYGASRGWLGATALAILSACVVAVSPALAQNVDGNIIHAVGTSTGKATGKEIQPVGCASCGGGLLGQPAGFDSIGPVVGGPGGIGDCAGCACGGEQCYAGKFPCDCHWHPESKTGQLFKGIYNCICCNDPCYEPTWISLANNAFTLDSPRPITHMKFGMDFMRDLRLPDKGELYWAQANRRGPRGGFDLGGGVNTGERSVDHNELYLYNEAALGGFGFFIQMPYRQLNPEIYGPASGFSDMIIGTKSVILDCELLLTTFQFKTFIPVGNAARGLGTGHVSLEPSLLSALKLSPFSYLQSQVGYRFPIGGTPGFQGSLVYGGLSYNHLLWNCGHDIELVGSLEGNVACVTNGRYTDPVTGAELPANDLGVFVNAGPGVRLVICRKVDFGVGTSFHLTGDSHIGHLVRAEFRWRF